MNAPEIAARQRDVWVSHCDGTVPPQIRPLDWLMVMHECDIWKGVSDCPRLMLASTVDWQWGGVLAFKIVIAAPGYHTHFTPAPAAPAEPSS